MNSLAALLRRAAGDPRPDGALLAAFLADRDEAAFAEVVRRHGGLVWGVCRRTLPDLADAEDAFQATFLVLVRRAGRLTHAATVGPWLHRVAAWTARNLRRKNARRLSRRRELSDALPAPSVPDPPCDLDALLLSLPERYRAALVLCHLGGLTHREAAARLGCAEGTVSSLVSRGLAKLRAKLAADPTPLLVAAAVGVAPASLSAVTVKSAAALQLASLSVAVSPAVASLVKGVLPMFWLKKATVAGMMAMVLVITGVGVGVSVRQTPQAVAQDDKPAPGSTKRPARPNSDPAADVRKWKAELKEVRDKLGEIARRTWRLTDPEIEQYIRLTGRAAELEARIKLAKVSAGEKKTPPVIMRQQMAAEQARTEQARAEARLTEAKAELDAATAKLQVAEAELARIRTVGANEFELIVGSPKADHPYSFIEKQANGDAELMVSAATEAGMRRYLARMQADPKAPKNLVISVAQNVPVDRLKAAVYAAKAAGYRRIRLIGNVPIGIDYLSHGPIRFSSGIGTANENELGIDLAYVPPETPKKP